MNVLRSLYLNHRFFYVLACIGALFCVSFFVPVLYSVATVLLLLLLSVGVIEGFALYSLGKGVEGGRELPDRLSNGDDNAIGIHLKNNYPFVLDVKILDEIPFQFQKRDFLISTRVAGQNAHSFKYHLRPVARGEYKFGTLNVYATTRLGLVTKRYKITGDVTLATYPSFIQLRKFDLMAFSNNLHSYGLKRIRRVGHTMEFEQIRDYVQGDDMRTINWKATSKKSSLMVNQYQDEKSQQIYQIIDTGRAMQMPFNGLSLLDYAINATLALSNIVLKKQDKAGMCTFSRKTANFIPAERKAGQLHTMMEALYHIETDFQESDYSRLLADLYKLVPRRSLIILYTNFETMDALYRQLNYLKQIAKNHLLLVVFFENTELLELINRPATQMQEVYDKIIAEKFSYEKRLIVRELTKYGIQTVLSPPAGLTMDTINKYLELKARGLI